jgi:hypothetical protein
MNKYKITTFTFGSSQAVIVVAFDILSAIQSGQVNQQEIVKVEFYGSTNEVDLT